MYLSSLQFLYIAWIQWFSCFVAVDDSAILDCHFSDFYHVAPQGFEKILFEQQIFWACLSWYHHPPLYRLTASLWHYSLTVIEFFN